MSKFPNNQKVEMTLDIINSNGHTTREELARILNLKPSAVSLIVRYLLKINLLQQRKDIRHSARGPKNYGLYFKRNTYVYIIDISTDVWRFLIGADTHKHRELCKYEYSYSMEFTENLARFASLCQRASAHFGKCRVYATAVILPYTNKNLSRFKNVGFYRQTLYADDEGLEESKMLRKIKSAFPDHIIIPTYRSSSLMKINISNTEPEEEVFISLGRGFCAYFVNGEDKRLFEINQRIENTLRRFEGELKNDFDHKSICQSIMRLCSCLVFDCGIKTIHLNLDGYDNEVLRKVKVRINRKIKLEFSTESTPRLLITSGSESPLYANTTHKAIRLYVNALLTSAKKKEKMKQQG